MFFWHSTTFRIIWVFLIKDLKTLISVPKKFNFFNIKFIINFYPPNDKNCTFWVPLPVSKIGKFNFPLKMIYNNFQTKRNDSTQGPFVRKAKVFWKVSEILCQKKYWNFVDLDYYIDLITTLLSFNYKIKIISKLR